MALVRGTEIGQKVAGTTVTEFQVSEDSQQTWMRGYGQEGPVSNTALQWGRGGHVTKG